MPDPSETMSGGRPSAKVPEPPTESVAARMSVTPHRDTTPELALRRELHRRGLRYRVEVPLPGRPRRRADVWFGPSKVAVFVDGCYWHGCPDHFTVPKSNSEWWKDKIATNRSRDADTDRHLRSIGVLPVRVWEHEDVRIAADRVAEIVEARRGTRVG